MASPRIRIIIPYFGRWPVWMPFFLESCRYNPTIDWLFFSDCGLLGDMPDNVELQEMTFAEYCLLVSERLGIRFEPASAYKLCDIKPALGHIHEKELADYDFWGFSDLDLVYGDLRGYFTDERLSRHDLYSTHERRVSGHFCLFRNTPRMRTLYREVPNWRESIAKPAHLSFDEKDFTRLFIRYKNLPNALRLALGKLNPLFKRSEFKEAFTTPNTRLPWIAGSMSFPAEWYWNRGRLCNDIDGMREFPYVHFLIWKTDPWGAMNAGEWMQAPEQAKKPHWVISAEGIKGRARPDSSSSGPVKSERYEELTHE